MFLVNIVVQSLEIHKVEGQLKYHLPKAVNWELKLFHEFCVSKKMNQDILSTFPKSVIVLNCKI